MKKTALALLFAGSSLLAVGVEQAAQKTCPLTKGKNAKACPAKDKNVEGEKKAADIWGFLPAVIANVDGKPVQKEEFIKYFTATLPEGKMPPRMGQEMLKQMAKRLVKTYVERSMLLDAAKEAGFKPSKELAEKNFRANLENLNAQQLEMVKAQLAQKGTTIDKFIAESSAKPQVQDNAAIDAFVNDRLISKISVSDKEVADYYKANKDKFKIAGDPKDSMRASHILIAFKEKNSAGEAKAKAKAEELEARLKKGESFEKLAEEYSACPSGKTAKGALGAFKEGQMVKPFEKAVKALKPGEVSGLVKTKFGYHIIRRDALQGPKEKKLADEASFIKQMLKQQKVAKEATPFIESIEKQHKIEYFVK